MKLGFRHSKVQRLRKLLRRSSVRNDEGVFVVEGSKLLEEAFLSGKKIESVFCVSEELHKATNYRVSDVINSVQKTGARVFDIDTETLERVSDIVHPQPVISIVSKLDISFDDIKDFTSVLVLVDVRDPGNAGTILRSAESAGIEAVVFCNGSVDVYNPKTVRSSAGSIFNVPVAKDVDFSEVVCDLKSGGFQCIGTAMNGSSIYEADFSKKIALFLGNEAKGLDENSIKSMSNLVSIPIKGHSESLNVAMAASVLCFEVIRQRL